MKRIDKFRLRKEIDETHNRNEHDKHTLYLYRREILLVY